MESGTKKEMRMALVVEATRAMNTLQEVNNQLALIGNTEKLKGLTTAFDNISSTLVRARQFSEELDKTIGKTMTDMATETEKAQKQVTTVVENTSKKVSAAVDKNAYDMKNLLTVQKELAKSTSILGQEFKKIESVTVSTPKIDTAKADAEMKKLRDVYATNLSRLQDMYDRYGENMSYKKNGDENYKAWYNDKNVDKIAREMATAAQRIAEIRKSKGELDKARVELGKLRYDLDSYQVVPVSDIEKKIGPVADTGGFFDSDYAKSLSKKLEDALVAREKEILKAEEKAVNTARKDGKAEFDKLYAKAKADLQKQVTEQVNKLLGIQDGVELSPDQQKFSKKLINQITDQLTMGQKLRQVAANATLEQKRDAARLATEMRDAAVNTSQELSGRGYTNGAITIYNAAMDDLKSMDVALKNYDTLMKDLGAKKEALEKKRDSLEKLNNQLKSKKNQKATSSEPVQTETTQASKKKTLKEPEVVISEFAQKIADAKTKTIDLSTEFGLLAKAIPVERANELVSVIGEAKRSLVQTLNAMVKATDKAAPKVETKDKKSQKPKKIEVDPQIREAAKDLEHAKANWEKLNGALPAPALAEAAANAKMLESALLAVTSMDYSKMTAAMEAIKKTSSTLVKAAAEKEKSKAEKKQESSNREKEAKAKNLVQQRAELIADLERRYTARPNTATETKSWQNDIEKLGTLTQKIIQMRMELGHVNAVTGDFKQALALATNPQVFDALQRQMDIFFASLERVNEAIRVAKANTPMAVEARTNKAFNAADKADQRQTPIDYKQADTIWAEHERQKKKASSDNAKALSDEIKLYHEATDAAERKYRATVTGLQDEARIRKAEWTKSQSNADTAWDALERQKLNQQDKMWRDYHQSRTKEQERLNRASENQIKLYNDLRDIEDRNHIKLIDSEQTKSLQEALKLVRQYIKLKEKLDDTYFIGKEMNKGQYRRNAREEQRIISGLHKKGIEVSAHYDTPYQDYAKPIQEIRAAEQLVLDTKKKQTEEARKHIEELSSVARKLMEIRTIMAMYKGDNGDIMSTVGYNGKRNQITNLTDRLYALSGQEGIARGIRESMLQELETVNRIQKTTTAVKNVTKELRNQIADATVKAEQLYRQFELTGSLTDKIRLQRAVKDLDDLQKKEAKMNKELGITESKLRQIINILKIRANWMFGGMTAGMLMSMPSELANSYREMEQAMAGVQQVLPLIEGNQREVNAETQRFISIAQEYARGVEEVVDAGRLWGRGYGKLTNDMDIEDTIKAHNKQSESILNLTSKERDYVRDAQAMATTNELVRQSAMLATVDNFSMAESVKGLEAILSAYSMRAKSAAEATIFAGRAVDIITKVSHTGQISAQDLVRGIQATGKAAQTAGISLSFLSAMIETGTRNTGLSGSEIGMAIKALTVGAHSKKGIKELEKFGISVSKIGEDGVRKLRPLQEVILDIADAIQKGDKNAENMVMAIAGGRYQYSKLYSILSDREEIMRQWGEAINSNGFADKQLEVQMNTINSKIKQIKASLESLIQTAMSSGGGWALKTLLDAINVGIKNLTTHMSALTTLASGGALVAAFIGLARVIKPIFDKFKDLSKLRTELKNLGEAGKAGKMGLLKDGTSEMIGNVRETVLGKKKQNQAVTEAIVLAEQEAMARKGVATAEGAEAAAGQANTASKRGQTAGAMAATTAETAQGTATNATTAALLRQAAVTTVATLGLNLLIAGVVVGASAWLLMSNAEEKANQELEKRTGLSDKAVEKNHAEVESIQQEIAARKEQLEYSDKAIELARNLQTELDNYTKAATHTAEEEKRIGKVKDELTLIEKNLSTAFSESAVKRIKEAGWTSEAYQTEKDNYIKATNDKEKKLTELNRGLHEYYSQKVDLLNNEKLQYENSIKNFGQWTWAQLNGLNILDQAWSMYWQSVWKNSQASISKIGDDIASLEAKKFKAMQAGDDAEYQRLSKEQDVKRGVQKNFQDTANRARGRALGGLIEGFLDKEGKTVTSLADATGKLVSFEKPFTGINDLFSAKEPPGEWEPSANQSKNKNGKGKHNKTAVGFGDIREQVYHNMALDGQVTGAGFDENHIKALAQMVNGEDSNNLFGLGESDEMMAGFKMAQKIKEFGANGGISGVLKAVFGDDSRLPELINHAKWYADNLDWGKAGNELFGVSNASDVAGSIVADADAHLGEQWISGDRDGNYNWEVQCASWVSYEMQKHGIKSINSANGDEIIRQAGSAYKAGEAPLNAGDIINWANHVGIYDGNGGYVARNSSGGVHHGTMKEAQQWFGSVLGRVDFTELAKQNGVKLRNIIPWVNSKSKQTIWNWQYDPKRHNALQEAQTNDILEKKYQLELKEAEAQKTLYGETVSYFMAVKNLEEQRLVNLKGYNERFRVQFETNQKTFNDYIRNHEGLQTTLKNQGVKDFFDLSDEEQKELMKRLADNGSQLDKDMEKMLTWLMTNKFKVQESAVAVKEQEAKVNRLQGSMTPREEEDLSIQRENDRYTLSKGFLDDPAAEKEHFNKLAEIYQSRLSQQEAELAIAHAETEKRISDLSQDIAKYEGLVRDTESKIQELQSLSNPTEAQKAELQKNMDALEERKKILADTSKVYTDLKINGSSTERTLENECRKTKIELKSVQDQSMKLEQNLTNTIAGGMTSMFSGMLLEGNSFKDGWQSLWKSIAQIAIKQLLEVWLFKKVLNLGSWFSGGMAEGGSVMDRATGAGGVAEGWNGNILDWPKPHKDGGLIGFATGGYTDGLIKGAGTGTSDSILTYLAHRGQFIKTSNGEYIVKKDSVDKMGVPFLDALNNNPEIVEKMKHYASGGSLGTEMIPTMKNTTVDSYYRYNSNKVLAQNQNKRLEELMLQQNELISSMGKGNDSGKVIVLNTQADSVSVMKAIQKNPRAIQKLLGHQQSHGFRG